MGDLTSDEAGELAALQRSLFASGGEPDALELARYEELHSKKREELSGGAEDADPSPGGDPLTNSDWFVGADSSNDPDPLDGADPSLDSERESGGAEGGLVVGTPPMKPARSWADSIRTFPALKKIGYLGVGLGLVAIAAGTSVLLPSLTPQPRPIASAKLESVGLEDLPQGVDTLAGQNANAMVATDIGGIDVYVVKGPTQTCVTLDLPSVLVGPWCESYSDVIVIDRKEIGGLASAYPDHTGRLIVAGDEVALWEAAPQDVEAYR